MMVLRASVLGMIVFPCLLCLGLFGCAFSDGTVRNLGRTGVQGATQGMEDSEATLRRALREVLLQGDTLKQIAARMTNGALSSLSNAEQKQYIDALATELTAILRKRGDEVLSHFLKLTGDQLEETLRRISTDSLARADATAKELLHKDLMEVSQLIVKHNTDLLAQTLSGQLEGPLGTSLEHAGGQLARAVVSEAARTLREEPTQIAAREFLRGAMREAVAGIGDGLKQELRSSPTQVALIAGTISLGVLLLALGGVLWFFVRQYLTSTKALALIAQKINETQGNQPLKHAIQEHAQRNSVESWLSDFLKHRGL